jgi:hypothetical protein
MGYGSRRPTRVSLLTPRHRTQLLTWACNVANWTLNAGGPRCISSRSLQRSLASIIYGSRRPTRVLLLTPRHRTQLLTWAYDVADWTLEYWEHVAWSDETRHQLFWTGGGVRVWRTPCEAMDPSCKQSNVETGGGSILVWVVFTWNGLVPLLRLNTSLTGDRYIALLSDHLQPFINFMYPHNDGIFQQENAPCHRAQVFQN